MHDSIGHCRWSKLLRTLCRSYWWLGKYTDIVNYIWHCLVYQQDRSAVLPRGELCWMDKGGATSIRWSIDVVGKFPWNKDRNHYLSVTMDPFSK